MIIISHKTTLFQQYQQEDLKKKNMFKNQLTTLHVEVFSSLLTEDFKMSPAVHAEKQKYNYCIYIYKFTIIILAV